MYIKNKGHMQQQQLAFAFMTTALAGQCAPGSSCDRQTRSISSTVTASLGPTTSGQSAPNIHIALKISLQTQPPQTLSKFHHNATINITIPHKCSACFSYCTCHCPLAITLSTSLPNATLCIQPAFTRRIRGQLLLATIQGSKLTFSTTRIKALPLKYTPAPSFSTSSAFKAPTNTRHGKLQRFIDGHPKIK
jgi:hypothetical protein